MKFLNSWTEIVSSCQVDGQKQEVCASVVAHHDYMSHELVVYCEAFVRRAAEYGPDEYSYPEWLIEPEAKRLTCSLEQAEKKAAECAAAWTARVRACIPADRPREHAVAVGENAFEREVWGS